MKCKSARCILKETSMHSLREKGGGEAFAISEHCRSDRFFRYGLVEFRQLPDFSGELHHSIGTRGFSLHGRIECESSVFYIHWKNRFDSMKYHMG